MKTDVYLFISQNYELIKKTLKKELRKNRNLEFDEDVFHDTILKCMEKHSDMKFNNEEEFLSYIIVSFKTNLKREKLYAYNATKYDGEIDLTNLDIKDTNYNKNNIDIDIILDKIEKEFGEDIANKAYDWIICQLTIKEINEKYNCKNARYIIDKVKDFIERNYSRNDFLK